MILVTGGMGFIGLHVVRSLLDQDDVVVTWNRSWRVPDFWAAEVGKRVLTERVDVSNAHEVQATAVLHKVESIVHLAAPGFGQAPLTQDYATNMQGLINVIETARSLQIRRLTYVSSSTLYSGLREGPYKEDSPLPLDSRNSTEAFKKAGEVLLNLYADQYQLDIGIVRPRQVYGPLYYSMNNLPSRMAHAAIQGTEPDYGRAGTPFADDTGDFTYVKDVAEVTRLVHFEPKLKRRVYNVGGGRAFRMQELADAVHSVISDARIPLQPGENPNGNPRDNYLSLERVKEDFGFTPAFPIEKGLPDYIAWLGNHAQ